jgi:hypothetical protein
VKTEGEGVVVKTEGERVVVKKEGRKAIRLITLELCC